MPLKSLITYFEVYQGSLAHWLEAAFCLRELLVRDWRAGENDCSNVSWGPLPPFSDVCCGALFHYNPKLCTVASLQLPFMPKVTASMLPSNSLSLPLSHGFCYFTTSLMHAFYLLHFLYCLLASALPFWLLPSLCVS